MSAARCSARVRSARVSSRFGAALMRHFVELGPMAEVSRGFKLDHRPKPRLSCGSSPVRDATVELYGMLALSCGAEG
jgi:hypothetical protein